MRGYFGIGVESSSKWLNAGNLLRTTHAFGGSFFFFVDPALDLDEVRRADTAQSAGALPVYQFHDASAILLPQHCQLIGVELTDNAVELPAFYHPAQAAYVLGPEKGSLSVAMQARCAQIVKIPTKFCVNVGIAGAIIMYDRLLTQKSHAPRRMMAEKNAAMPQPYFIDTTQEFPKDVYDHSKK